MKEFFHGWRRKAGVVALVMTLGVTSLWIRSFVVLDYCNIRCGYTFHNLNTAAAINWSRQTIASGGTLEFPPDYPVFFWGSLESTSETSWGFAFTDKKWSIPFWSLILPLLLASTYLLLWKPRKRA